MIITSAGIVNTYARLNSPHIVNPIIHNNIYTMQNLIDSQSVLCSFEALTAITAVMKMLSYIN